MAPKVLLQLMCSNQNLVKDCALNEIIMFLESLLIKDIHPRLDCLEVTVRVCFFVDGLTVRICLI